MDIAWSKEEKKYSDYDFYQFLKREIKYCFYFVSLGFLLNIVSFLGFAWSFYCCFIENQSIFLNALASLIYIFSIYQSCQLTINSLKSIVRLKCIIRKIEHFIKGVIHNQEDRNDIKEDIRRSIKRRN